ncbi:MAG: MoaD/ThiS family protein [Candidatus Sericytochromatia bacterium]
MIKINIEYFAKLKDERKLKKEVFETESKTLLDLYKELQFKYHFSLDYTALKVALNDEFSEWDNTIKDNDIVVFIPPVAGG